MAWDILDWFMERVMGWLIIGFIALVAIGIPLGLYAGYLYSKSPHISLKKSEWACTATQRVQTTTYIKSGNVMVPMTTYSNVCNQWSRQ